MSNMQNQFRFLSAIVLQAKTPLLIGSGNKTIKTDSQINLDCNGLPFIPGTTLAGVLRHSFEETLEGEYYDINQMFGSHDQNTGSRLIVSEAKILDQDGDVIDGLLDTTLWKKERQDFFKHFNALPIRQHAKIGHRGTTVEGGKFDEEVIFKGARFCFEMELVSNCADDEKFFKRALDIICGDTFWIGGKTNSGYGKVEAVQCKYKKIDFSDSAQFDAYLGKSAKINYKWDAYAEYDKQPIDSGLTKYKMELQPEDFIFFSSGFGNEKADNTSVKEIFIQWDSDCKAHFVGAEKSILIPASSVKGAIAHRTAFHYNKLKGILAEKTSDLESVTGKNNTAVKMLFGSEGDKQGGNTINKRKGVVTFSDVLREKKSTTIDKVFNHVAIDRFTGGTIDGALFNGEYLYAKDETITLEIFLHESRIDEDKENVVKAFESALKDVRDGILPLGGGVTKGNGLFNCKSLTKNGQPL